MKSLLAMVRPLGVILVLLGVALYKSPAAQAQAGHESPPEQATGFLQRIYEDNEGEHRYALFVPKNYTPQKQWPVILFLHGAGERGSDGQRQTQVGLGPFVKQRVETFPFIVVFPQAKVREKTRLLKGWAAGSPDARRAMQILKTVEGDYHIDASGRILTGWSMGGYGTWSLAMAHPGHFSAIVPVSGGGDPMQVDRIRDLPVWAFHGAKDQVVPVDESRKMVEALRAAGGRPRYTEVPDSGHDVWKVVYNRDGLYDWMLDPTADPRTQPRDAGGAQGALLAQPGERPAEGPDLQAPFRPAVEISDAVVLRLGNDVLREAGRSIPMAVSNAEDDLLSGRIDDMYDSTVTEGRSFRVHFSRIRYRGDLARAHVEAVGTDRLRIQLGLEDVTLTIGRTDVQGEGRYAVAGPIDIVIGHREPVWLTVDVTPYVRDRQIRLRVLQPYFSIPDENWYVTSPAGVSTEGLGMTRERVSSGLVNGLYGSKERIEGEVLSAVPDLVRRAEQRLNEQEMAGSVDAFWPLPVYQPRVRLWPQSVTTDEGGVTVRMGLTAAAIDPQNAPETPRRVEVSEGASIERPGSPDLQVGVVANVLEPLTQLLIDADVARIHVLDIPEDRFAAFADRAALQQAIPDLSRLPEDVELWSELILARPLTVADNSARPTFQIPKLLISLAVRVPSEGAEPSEWTPYAEFEFSVSQAAKVEASRPNFQTRKLNAQWSGDPEIEVTGRFAPQYDPENSQLNLTTIRQMFGREWTGWTGNTPLAQREISDVDLGYSKLRLETAAWSAPHLVLTFAEPGIKLTNLSEQPLVYETKGPFSDWGGPYTLSPDNSHTIPIAYPMLFRRRIDGEWRMFTLPAGSHSEFRVPTAGGSPRLFQAREQTAPPAEMTEEGN